MGMGESRGHSLPKILIHFSEIPIVEKKIVHEKISHAFEGGEIALEWRLSSVEIICENGNDPSRTRTQDL